MTAVILFEDDGALREVLRTALQAEGHDVVALLAIEQLPEHAARLPEAVALVDGWGTGYGELAETDRRAIQAVASSLPTILLSGRPWVDRVEPEELGVVALLSKPTDLDCLLTLVSQAQSHLEPCSAYP